MLLLYLYFALSCGSVDGHFYALYNPYVSVNNYYISNSLVNLPAYNMTLCFWWKSGNDTAPLETMISMARSGMENRFIISRQLDEMLVHFEAIVINRFTYIDDKSWQFHCISAEFSQGTYQIKYHIKEKISTGWNIEHTSTSKPYASRNENQVSLVFYNEQDTVGGSFDPKQVSAGWIACVNIYSQSFTADELLDFSSCTQQGDVFSLKPGVGQMYGDVAVYESSQLLMGINNGNEADFCTFKNQVMVNLTLSTHTSRNQLQCLTLCMETESCTSVNYEIESRRCELGSTNESKSIDGWLHASLSLCVYKYLL